MNWHDTARELAAHPRCPEGLAQHVVSRGELIRDYHFCESRCETWWSERPGVDDTVPDLTNPANAGILLTAIGEHCGTPDFPKIVDEWWTLSLYPQVTGWLACLDHVHKGVCGTERDAVGTFASKHLAYVAARVFLARWPTQTPESAE